MGLRRRRWTTGIFWFYWRLLGYFEGALRRESSSGSRGGGSRLCKQDVGCKIDLKNLCDNRPLRLSRFYVSAVSKLTEGHLITLRSCENVGDNEDQLYPRYLLCLLSPFYICISFRLMLMVYTVGCASGCVVECRICNREVAGSNLGLGYFTPRSTQPSIPLGSVNEYQLRLERRIQVWLIPIADERVGVQVKLRNPLRTRAIPEPFAVVIHYEEALYQVYAPLQ